MISSAKRRPLVLVVDDIQANRELLEGQLAALGYDVREAADGQAALDAIADAEPDLVLLDVEMPKINGLDVCRRIKSHPLRRLVPVVLITARTDRATRLAGLEAGADDFLTKPFDAQELLVRTKVLLRDRALNLKLDAAESVLLAMARAVEARDSYTVLHAERVGEYARGVAEAYGLDADDLDVVYRGGVLHDLGKIGIRDAILSKPGPLTAEEFAVMKGHSLEGERICAPLRSTAHYLPIIRHHHERWDGAGYPDGLSGDSIPIGARIVAVADAWDAMVTDRPYRAGLPCDEATRRLATGAGSQWDERFVRLFLRLREQPSARVDGAIPGGPQTSSAAYR
ncbi:MAG TPA: HD domain-containing phosphohydrolase [Candidatus Limnocylindria bacterium]|nr:HD domain-containing phosphohydrolase [Candidatus Limnocylindria bacterium]